MAIKISLPWIYALSEKKKNSVFDICMEDYDKITTDIQWLFMNGVQLLVHVEPNAFYYPAFSSELTCNLLKW